MKKPLLLSLAVIFLCSSEIYSESYQQKQDTLKKEESIQITPGYYPTRVNSLGSFGVIAKDTLSFQINAGLNVFNTLRGNVPNLNIDNDPTTVSGGGIRSSESLLIIDGVPFSQEITSHYNFNSFEYENIYAFGSGNAATLYGPAGTAGAVFLESKNGKNFMKPTVEFNSTTSFMWGDSPAALLLVPGATPPEQETITQWRFSNSVAFMQDFGKIDTRISYNYSALPDGSYGLESKTNHHNIRINTGFDITSRFNARLILDNVYGKDFYASRYFSSGSTREYETETFRRNLQGNLILRCDPFDWLTLSSQTVFTKLSYDSETDTDIPQDNYNDQQRTLFNLFTTAHKAIIPKLSFNATVGFQASMQNFESTVFTNNTLWGSKYQESTNDAIIGGLGLEFDDFLFAGLNYRADKNSIYGTDHSFHNYSYVVSFVFSEAFNLNTQWFSLGKLRGSIGNADLYSDTYSFPDDWTPSNTTDSPGASSKNIYETGMDLAFFKNRVLLTGSYFQNKDNQTLVNMSIPGSGYQSVYINLGAMKSTGWEVMLGVTSIRKTNFFINTKLTWTATKTEIESKNEPAPTTIGNLPKFSPDWYGTILNQVNWKNFFTTFIINVQNGGSYLSYDGTRNLTFRDASETRLRDISFGYRFTPAFLDRLNIRSAQVALSGRNLWLIDAEDKQEWEGSYFNSNRKSVNLSLTLLF